MYIYNKFDKFILYNKFLEFKVQLLDYLSGKLSEFEFKVFRLQNGLYRQRFSYMYRLLIPYGYLSLNQLYFLSYLSEKYDNKYFHLTTRTNIQFNWISLVFIIDIINNLIFLNIHSIQSSGNCVRNITINQYLDIFNDNNYLDSKIWAELLRQWFYIHSEFLFLPRKFKIAVLSSKYDFVNLKIHDLGIIINKNSFNKIIFSIIVGGGLGRTPIIGNFLFKYLHWKNILSYCDKIIRLYNISGFRDNIYKARIKILLKSISILNFSNMIKNEINYSNNIFYILNEREVNRLLKNFIKVIKKIFKIFFTKKIRYNFFFLNWLRLNIISNLNFNFSNLSLCLKIYNSPSGDINIFQVKILVFYSYIYNYNFISITNRQNFVINNFNNFYLFHFYKVLKKFFFNISNLNLITDIVTCPGYDFCSLANAESISIYNNLQNLFLDYKTILKLNNISINISGCINSCAHHHISNLGILGVNKNNDNWYQLYIGGQNIVNNIKLSKVIGPSFLKNNITFIINKIIKKFLIFRYFKESFVDTYNRLGFYSFKNYIFE